MKQAAASPRIGRCGAVVIAAALATIVPVASRACGACVEDKIAATYDHSVVERAAASGDVMVFCEVTGSLDVQRLRRALGLVHGVKALSVRVSAQQAALSFAVDPRSRSPQAAVDAVQRTLVPGTRLTIVHLRPPLVPSP